MTGTNGFDLEEAIRKRLLLRDWLEREEARYKKRIASHVELAAQLDGQLLEHLDQTKAESVRTNRGTVYISEREYAQVQDEEAFVHCIRETGLIELFQVSASGPACKEYAEEYGSLPPGVGFNIHRSAVIRRA